MTSDSHTMKALTMSLLLLELDSIPNEWYMNSENLRNTEGKFLKEAKREYFMTISMTEDDRFNILTYDMVFSLYIKQGSI